MRKGNALLKKGVVRRAETPRPVGIDAQVASCAAFWKSLLSTGRANASIRAKIARETIGGEISRGHSVCPEKGETS